MRDNHLTSVLLLILSSFLIATMIKDVTRAWRRRKYGPSEKEFVDACQTITVFMHRHNRSHPKALIKSITLSPDGGVASDPPIDAKRKRP